MRIRGRFGIDHFFNDAMIGIDIAETASRRENLREAVGKNGMTGFVVCLDRLQVLTAVAQIAIGVIFEDQDVVFASERGERFPTVGRECFSCTMFFSLL